MATEVEFCAEYNSYMYLPPTAQKGCNTGQFLNQRLIGFHSEFSYSLTGGYIKVSLPYYFSIAGGRLGGCTPFAMRNASRI